MPPLVRWFVLAGLTALSLTLSSSVSFGMPPGELPIECQPSPDGIHVIDGSYVMNVGQLHVNITNFGLIGSKFNAVSTYADAPSGQWPGGSGDEYLWAAGLWVGGILGGEPRVSTGQFDQELRPEPEVENTIYEARECRVVRPRESASINGRRFPDPGFDDDGDGSEDEEILDGKDNDEDGQIDEDFGQAGEQMMTCVMTDNTLLAQEIYTDHQPLNIAVIQNSYSWSQENVQNFVILDYTITNIGAETIKDMYVGMFVDCDIGPRSGSNIGSDDMAGFYKGMTRCSDGMFLPTHVGYMYDAAEKNPLPGYFGVCMIDHTSSIVHEELPYYPGVVSYNRFSGYQSFIQGGDPTNDGERYGLMSTYHFDKNSSPNEVNDHRFLISSGPFSKLESGQSINIVYALVIGDGFEDMLTSCASAARTWYGGYFDRSPRPWSGIQGRESKVCLGDFDLFENGENRLYYTNPWAMDMHCSFPTFKPFSKKDLFWDWERQDYCIYVNLDNCIEPLRIRGGNYPSVNYKSTDSMEISQAEMAGITGINGKETPIRYLLDMPPDPPGMRFWPTNGTVHVFWNDKSEHSEDSRFHNNDFESYRIWRSDHWSRPPGTSLENGPMADSWQMIAEFDKVSEFIKERTLYLGTVVADTLPLGRNTGLDTVAYEPRVLHDPSFIGLKEAMAEYVAGSDCVTEHLSGIYDTQGVLQPEAEILEPWTGYPTALDTFYMTTYRPVNLESGVAAKDSVKFYEYVDHDVHNGFVYFYSVTATDAEQRYSEEGLQVVGPGLVGHPSSSFGNAVPGSVAKNPDDYNGDEDLVYVYPNPATRESLAEFQEMQPSSSDPTGTRVRFANLPRAHNKIKIFTIDGDLVQEINHDGTDGYGEVTWNLTSRNGQQVVSGVYLFSVDADDSRFEHQIGKFVLIR